MVRIDVLSLEALDHNDVKTILVEALRDGVPLVRFITDDMDLVETEVEEVLTESRSKEGGLECLPHILSDLSKGITHAFSDFRNIPTFPTICDKKPKISRKKHPNLSSKIACSV